eukprot:766392_1
MLAILFGILITITKSTSTPSATPVASPSAAPTLPTAPPVDYGSLTFETCVSDSSLVGSISVALSRNAEYNMMKIKIKGTDSAWFAYGFGSQSMQGTYAIVVNSAGIKEYTLGTHSSYTEGIDNPDDMVMTDATLITENTWVMTPEDETEDGIRTITIMRPYAYDTGNDAPNTFDFSDFMNKKVNSLNVISAYGDTNAFEYHGINNRGSGSIT